MFLVAIFAKWPESFFALSAFGNHHILGSFRTEEQLKMMYCVSALMEKALKSVLLNNRAANFM